MRRLVAGAVSIAASAMAGVAHAEEANDPVAAIGDGQRLGRGEPSAQRHAGVSPAFHLTGFLYALDFDTPVALDQSTRHLSLRATGGVEDAATQFDYAASYANQVDYGHSALT